MQANPAVQAGAPAPGRLTTGLPALDRVMRDLAPGDNIVWQVEAIEDYRALVLPYAEAARAAGARLIYFRFASHEPLLPASFPVERHDFDPQAGFEPFTEAVHAVIEEAGPGAHYLFDCLSTLADAWQADQMMGNFFLLTCPRLLDLQTVTYFALYRNQHTRHATDVIENTTQYLLDVFRRRPARLYIRPRKVPHRSLESMNLIHAWEGDAFTAVTDSATVSEILADSQWPGLQADHHQGYWQRFFADVRKRPPTARAADLFDRAAVMLLGDEPRLRELARRYLTLGDLTAVRDRQIGIGRIGGKAVGMLLARGILRRQSPAQAAVLESHDSFYVGAEVFRTFLIQNGLWAARRRQRDPVCFLQGATEAQARMRSGTFPAHTLQQFAGMLEYFGEWPYIVRSSSLLEDAYGNAFAGKYESVFCVNRGTPEQRLTGLLDAVRHVYASAMSEEALQYRQRRGLLNHDEQMALLIMRVSGSAQGRYFYPQAAGVGLSFNPYPWERRIDPAAGVVRLVFGMGTRAVDRVDDDYTRLVALNAPLLRPESTAEEVWAHSQRLMDALDLETGALVSRHVLDAFAEAPASFPLDAYRSRLRDEAGGERDAVTFEGLLRGSPFVAHVREMLAVLQQAYANPVEIEFTVNLPPDGALRLHVLQCRTLQVRTLAAGPAALASTRATCRVLECRGAVIGMGGARCLEAVIQVVPESYAGLPMQSRHEVARVIGRLNRALGPERPYLLMGPGRWGTRDPALGIPVTFSEINHAAALCEVVAMHGGLAPDASLGAHFLSELVELDMLYLTLSPDRPGNWLHADWWRADAGVLAALSPADVAWTEVIRVRLAPGLTLQADSPGQSATLLAPA